MSFSVTLLRDALEVVDVCYPCQWCNRSVGSISFVTVCVWGSLSVSVHVVKGKQRELSTAKLPPESAWQLSACIDPEVKRSRS